MGKNTKTQETRGGFAVSKFESFVRKNTKTHKTHWLSDLGPGKNTKTRRTHGAFVLAKLKVDKQTQIHIAHMNIVNRYLLGGKNTKTQETRGGFALFKFESCVSKKNAKTHRTHWLCVLGPEERHKNTQNLLLVLPRPVHENKTQKHLKLIGYLLQL